MFDLDDTNARWANCNDVDFIGLELMSNGESQISQQHPFVITLCGLQATFQLRESLEFTFIGCWPTGEKRYSHIIIAPTSLDYWRIVAANTP